MISILCQANTNAFGGRGGGRFAIRGPLRMDVWQYHDGKVDWERPTDFSKPFDLRGVELDSWTGGLGGDAEMLGEAISAIAGSVYQ